MEDDVDIILEQPLVRVFQTELVLEHVSRYGNHLLSKVWMVVVQVFKQLNTTTQQHRHQLTTCALLKLYYGTDYNSYY